MERAGRRREAPVVVALAVAAPGGYDVRADAGVLDRGGGRVGGGGRGVGARGACGEAMSGASSYPPGLLGPENAIRGRGVDQHGDVASCEDCGRDWDVTVSDAAGLAELVPEECEACGGRLELG